MPHVIDYLLFDEYTEDPPIESVPEGGFWYNTTEDRLKQKVGTASGTMIRTYVVEEDIPVDASVQANTAHRTTVTGNPHSVTKDDVGLTNVDNESQLYRSSADFDTFPQKTTVSGGDIVLIEDVSDSWSKKKVEIDDLITAASGVTNESHRTLRHLIHFIDDGPGDGFTSGAYREVIDPSPTPSGMVWWESSSKLKKLVSLDLTWTANRVIEEEWKIYDTDGSSVLATVTDTINYTGVFETDRTRTIT